MRQSLCFSKVTLAPPQGGFSAFALGVVNNDCHPPGHNAVFIASGSICCRNPSLSDAAIIHLLFIGHFFACEYSLEMVSQGFKGLSPQHFEDRVAHDFVQWELEPIPIFLIGPRIPKITVTVSYRRCHLLSY